MRCPGCGYTANALGATTCKLCGGDMEEEGGSSRGSPPPRGAPAPVRGGRAGRGGPAGRGGRPAPRKGPPRDWTRYMLEQPGGLPKTLEPGTRFTLGRSTDCDLTIPSQRVSREHAELTWKGKIAFLTDLGSANVAQVNGRPASQPVELKDGDEITVGPYTCTYRAQSGVGSVARLSRESASLNTVADMADALAGNLEQMSLWELLDTLEHNEKTGTLEVFHPEGQAAKLVLKGGWPIYASLDEKTGRDAVYDLLAWEEGMFRFGPGGEDEEPNLPRVTINALLHEANERLGG